MHIPVKVYENVTREEFNNEIHPKRLPALLRGLNIGECTYKWTSNYICNKVENVDVKVHVCSSPQMDFISKNFMYKTLPFHELLRRASAPFSEKKDYFISPGEYYYLRSLGFDRRGKDAADIKKQFPTLAQDIIFPDFFDDEDFHSSVFRIGSPGVQLWTHYDVMDNLLIQVHGKKRMALFSPSEALNMYLEGDKSRVIDIDNPNIHDYPKFVEAQRYECIMEPGDILFIPALWFHNALALDFGIAVNVFWKNLKHELYDRKDPYGNKDPIPANKALQMVENASKLLDTLPVEYKDFYIKRMITILEKKSGEAQ
ncbi:tRNA wybutosine-synthesizing protein 5 [Blattella germanica]|nr:tRNA wybutosine-synthesizing protein 5 [Blattella germanica]